MPPYPWYGLASAIAVGILVADLILCVLRLLGLKC